MSEIVKGYKVFLSDWTCRGKQYSCPGKFEEEVDLRLCNQGMHFCKKAADCFNYYSFNTENKVAEVAAYGTVVEEGDKCCTDKLEIIREIPWQELLEIVNMGKGCTGLCNTGSWNSGSWNTGNWNSGDRNSGSCNSGNCNSGNCNSGNWNSGNWNSGDRNSGSCNSGNCNSGSCNSGNCNSGSWNSGSWNTGNRNDGNCNSGSCNTGNCNSGSWNSGSWNTGNRNDGNCNSGSWNKTNYSNGCFNTVEPKIHLFNRLSEWTYQDWLHSDACFILNQMPVGGLEYVSLNEMTDEEKVAHPEAKTTGGYIRNKKRKSAMEWWQELKMEEKNIIRSIPNFDADIFGEITGIDVNT